jgi:putative transposase
MHEVHSNKYHSCYLQYHIVFFINADIRLGIEERDFITSYFNGVSLRHGFQIKGMEIKELGARLTINCKTTHYIPNLIKALKGGAARFLFQEYPDSKLKNGDGGLWSQRYLIATQCEKLDEMIKEEERKYTGKK